MGEDHFYLMIYGQMFIDCCDELCCFNELEDVDPSLITMTLLALSSILGFHCQEWSLEEEHTRGRGTRIR